MSAIDEFLRSGAVTKPSVLAGQASHGPPTETGIPLTGREIQVLALVASGSTNKRVAGELGVTVATVERHVANIYAKIGARGRVDATAYAIRHGVGNTAPDEK